MFTQIISPLSASAFTTEYLGQQWLRLRGEHRRFQDLFSWDDLNSILECYPLAPPRLRLVRNGNEIDPARYLSERGPQPRIRSAGLANELGQGATLILNGLHQLVPAIRECVQSVEAELGSRSTVNLYAGWRTERGFNLHWDDHDVFVLQVHGRKHWKVHAPTRAYPLRQEAGKARQPSGEAVWDGLLEEGDLLYLPRGWWHVANPLNEASLHLTLSLRFPTGVEFLHWIVDGLSRAPDARMDLPRTPEGRAQYASGLRELLTSWNTDQVERFVDAWTAAVPAAPRVRLPAVAPPNRAALTPDRYVRLAGVRQLAFKPIRAGGFSFLAGGVRWSCAAAILPALSELRDERSVRIGSLLRGIGDPLGQQRLLTILTALAMAEAIVVEESTDRIENVARLDSP